MSNLKAMRYTVFVLLSTLALVGCSTDNASQTETPINQPEASEEVKLGNTVSSRGHDTILAGEEFATRVYLNQARRASIAQAQTKSPAFLITYNPALQQAKFDTATMVGDTGIVRFTPQVGRLATGEVRAYEWVYQVAVDFNARYPGADTIFMVRDVLYIKGRP